MDQEQISGTLERITFHNPENGFAVLQVKIPDTRDVATVVGFAPVINTGEYIDARGRWHIDQRFGMQFRAEHITAVPPTTAGGIQKYLASGLVRGVGPEYAARLIALFGERVFDVIDREPERLTEVPGIGPKRKDAIVSSWKAQKAARNIMLFLFQHGVGPMRAATIWRRYGEDAIARIRTNPYCLADEVRGIGFQIADRIARSMGVDPQSLERARAGLRFTLNELLVEGHAAYPQETLLARAQDQLEIARERLDEALAAERETGRLLVEEVDGAAWVYLSRLWYAETGIARLLLALRDGRHPLTLLDPPRAVRDAEARLKIALSPSQREAVLQALCRKVLILTGGPGVGKTTIVKVILSLYEAQGLRPVLCAPTGRAAKRLSEACGLEAKTIHRLLEVDPSTGGFRRGADRPLKAHVVVVDEASMVDIPLMHHLLEAVPEKAALLVVGDVDQLPSVGPGLVLSDMIASGVLPVTRLTEIFRQDQASKIIISAHAVNSGRMPWLQPPESLSDFYFVRADDPDTALGLVVRLVKERIPARFGFNPVRDIQVLAPMTRGTLGTRHLNQLLQNELNPGGADDRLERFGVRYAVGDKVMQRANDYDKDVFNGDIGFVCAVDRDLAELVVDFEGRQVAYAYDELEDLFPAYAITIHKSQGCEFPAVVIPLHTQHYVMLQRNLLYTAITRGRRLVVIVGSTRAVAIAVNTIESSLRCSALRKRLQGLLPLGRAP